MTYKIRIDFELNNGEGYYIVSASDFNGIVKGVVQDYYLENAMNKLRRLLEQDKAK